MAETTLSFDFDSWKQAGDEADNVAPARERGLIQDLQEGDGAAYETLISQYQHLLTVEGVPFGRTLIVRGATERLAPILMTACTTGLALLPLVVMGDRPGHEIERPMAIVILGGLISSTFLSLVLLPALYQWLYRQKNVDD